MITSDGLSVTNSPLAQEDSAVIIFLVLSRGTSLFYLQRFHTGAHDLGRALPTSDSIPSRSVRQKRNRGPIDKGQKDFRKWNAFEKGTFFSDLWLAVHTAL